MAVGTVHLYISIYLFAIFWKYILVGVTSVAPARDRAVIVGQ